MLRRIAALLLVMALCASCQKFAEGRLIFRELLALRDQIAKEFHEKVVDVSVTGDRMTVKFIDSPFSTRTADEKQRRADEVAAFVIKNYKEPLSSVSVQFVTRRAGGVVSVGETYVGRTAPTP